MKYFALLARHEHHAASPIKCYEASKPYTSASGAQGFEIVGITAEEFKSLLPDYPVKKPSACGLFNSCTTSYLPN